MTSAAAIAFELRPSALLRAIAWIVSVLAVLALWFSGLRETPWLAVGASGVVLFVALHRIGRLQPRRWQRVGWNAEGVWTLLDESRSLTAAQLLGWHALGLMLLVRLRSEAGEGVTLYLLPDNLDGATRRRLRVRLAQEALRPASR